jgi:hypothetical protein
MSKNITLMGQWRRSKYERFPKATINRIRSNIPLPISLKGKELLAMTMRRARGITGTSKGGNPLMNSEAWRNCGKILGWTFKE